MDGDIDDNLFDPNSNSQDNLSVGGSSTDQEDEHDFTDTDAAIDRMLDELNDFQLELDTTLTDNLSTNDNSADSDDFPPPPQLQTEVHQFPSAFSNSLDQLRSSTMAIDESPEVDLDMLLEDLCSMSKSITKNGGGDHESRISSDTSLTHTLITSTTSYSGTSKSGTNLFPQQNYQTLSPKSPQVVLPTSSTNVTTDVQTQLDNLQEELETKELTPEQQAVRIKAEKIRIALEKMKQAQIQKLVIKVFDDKLDTSKSMMIDTTWTVRQVVRKMIKKDDQESNPNWSLIETLPDMNMERIMEDNEKVLQTIFNWSRETTNCLVFSKRKDKYTLFRNPQNFLLGSGTSAGAAQLAEKSKDILLNEFFTQEQTRIPEVDGILWLKEGKRSWVKHYFVLRASGIYYTAKGKTKASRDLLCLAKFEHCDIYFGTGWRKKFKSPTDHVFCLKHPKVQTAKSKHIYSLCVEDLKTLHLWVNGIRMAKFGYQMYKDYLITQENVEKELLTRVADREMSSFGREDDNMSEQKLTVNGNHVLKAQTERPRSLKREPLLAEMREAQTVCVKGKGGGGNIGSLFSNAWKKGVGEEVQPDIMRDPQSPQSANLSPDLISTFSFRNPSFSTKETTAGKPGNSILGELKLDHPPPRPPRTSSICNSVHMDKGDYVPGPPPQDDCLPGPPPPMPPRRSSSLSSGSVVL